MNICIFGDSITWGAVDHDKGGWAERLKTYFMERQEGVNLYNLGVSGDNTDDLLKRFDVEASAREAALIVFAIGINDSQYIKTTDNPRVSLEKFENNIFELVKQAKKFTNKILFVSPTRVDESKTMPIPWDTVKYYDNENIKKYSDLLKKFCNEERLTYVDIQNLLDTEDLYDGLHPFPQGHQKIFEIMKEAVKKLQTNS